MKPILIENRYFTTSCLLFTTYYLLFLSGCATVPVVTPPGPKIPEGTAGIYHRVEKSQTLWRISKIYGVDLDELAKINHISDATNIEVGQLIFIAPHQEQPPLYNKFSAVVEDFIWPIRGKIIATFGRILNNTVNKGINIQPYSDADVVASRSGKVVFYDPGFKGFGKTVIIDHGDGFSTVYARNSQVFIKVGDTVLKGNPIAKVGSGEDRDKNIYLHFQIRKGYIPQNPSFYLP